MSLLTELYLTHPAWGWAAAAAALLAAELATGSGWLLWPAASAGVVAALNGLIPIPQAVAVLAFAALTILSTASARRYFPRKPDSQDINDNIGRLVGHEGRVVAAFRGRSGRVFVDGKEWAAELDAPGSPEPQPLEAGARVEVTAVSGARLTVRGV